MRDKTVFIVCSTIAITFAYFVGKGNTQQTGTVFDEVIIKGALTVGKEKNAIILEATDTGAGIIIQSQDSVVFIHTYQDTSVIEISNDVKNKQDTGVVLISRKVGNASVSDIHVRDDFGKNWINTIDKHQNSAK